MADLKTIISLSHDELRRNLPVQQAVAGSLETLKPREADVVSRRHGLTGHRPETLQQLGEELHVTRERVRQIEQSGLLAFRTQLASPPLKDVLAIALEIIRQSGGIIARRVFLDEFLLESQRTPAGQAAAAFLVEQSGAVTCVAESRKAKSAYAVSTAHGRAVEQLVPVLTEVLTSAEAPQSVASLTTAVKEHPASRGVGYLISEPFILAILEIGKGFCPTPKNTWGLTTWADINPRNIREKTLYTLRQAGEPLHFTEITQRITAADFDGKRVTTQAVHNELINGSEFVLIGRGIYALAEWGYHPGTVADVIRQVLTEADKPLGRDEIVEAVLNQRRVSRNTVLINLQDKSRFSRVDKQMYGLVE